MPLASQHFKDSERLQDCLEYDEDHVVQGERGPHVALIQQALIQLGAGVISSSEISAGFYGPSTASAVLRFKGPPRNIINRAYQNAPDSIVGRMTIAQLDKEMQGLENSQKSLLVSQTTTGASHNHSRCPALQAGEHEATPINPQNWGLKINIYGAGETDYLGFLDYAIDPRWFKSENAGIIRPLTWDQSSYQSALILMH